jgi:hypothetical protein
VTVFHTQNASPVLDDNHPQVFANLRQKSALGIFPALLTVLLRDRAQQAGDCERRYLEDRRTDYARKRAEQLSLRGAWTADEHSPERISIVGARRDGAGCERKRSQIVNTQLLAVYGAERLEFGSMGGFGPGALLPVVRIRLLLGGTADSTVRAAVPFCGRLFRRSE